MARVFMVEVFVMGARSGECGRRFYGLGETERWARERLEAALAHAGLSVERAWDARVLSWPIDRACSHMTAVANDYQEVTAREENRIRAAR